MHRNITDLATRRACTNVSSVLRELCQDEVILTDDFDFPQYDGSKISESAAEYIIDSVTGVLKVPLYLETKLAARRGSWVVVLGSEGERRSLMSGFRFFLLGNE